MVNRLAKPLLSNSFFIFGARGTGKSTFIQHFFKGINTLSFDLLDDEVFDRLMLNPKLIEEAARDNHYEWIVLDEIQRLPKLLNVVHRLIEKNRQKFALTGSSARKLKRGAANLLAGRAFVNSLFPFTSVELGDAFKLNEALRWGTLPKIFELATPEEKTAYLRSYVLTYVREEIQLEQVVRKLEPFREFLGVAAQMSGKIVNAASLGREVGAQGPTVQTYYQILEDTHLGFFLPHFHRSVRKSQLSAPKFYLFDNGVKKALEGSLDSIPSPATSVYGDLFEAFIIQEIFRLNQYYQKDFRLSYFATKGGAEIDLILSKGRKLILIEIKSSDRINEAAVRKLARTRTEAFPESQAYYLSQDPQMRRIDDVECLPWLEFLRKFKGI